MLIKKSLVISPNPSTLAILISLFILDLTIGSSTKFLANLMFSRAALVKSLLVDNVGYFMYFSNILLYHLFPYGISKGFNECHTISPVAPPTIPEIVPTSSSLKSSFL